MKSNEIDSLTVETQDFMKSVRNALKKAGALDRADCGALHILQTEYETYILAEKEIKKNGLVQVGKYGLTANPAINIKDKSCHQVLALMKEFGLTAKARQHIKKLDTPDEETPLDSFLKGQMDKARKESR